MTAKMKSNAARFDNGGTGAAICLRFQTNAAVMKFPSRTAKRITEISISFISALQPEMSR